MLCHDIELGDKAGRNRTGLFYPCVPLQSHMIDTSQQGSTGVRKVCFALSADQIMSTSCAFLRVFPALILCVCTSAVPPVSTGDSSPCLAPLTVLGVHISLNKELTHTQSQPLCGSPRSVWVTADRTVTSRPAKAACLAACDIQPPSH